MLILDTISDEISKLQAESDFGDISPENMELLAVLNLCYDLLSRTRVAQSETVETPEEMKEPGFEDDTMLKYGTSSSQLADFAFTVCTKNGTVDIRKLLFEIMFGHTQTDIAEKIGIRYQTISDYKTGKRAMTTSNYQSIINEVCKKQ